MSENLPSQKFRDLYPTWREVDDGYNEGTIFYAVEMFVGGRDENGEFLLVLDGPAQGERVYL